MTPHELAGAVFAANTKKNAAGAKAATAADSRNYTATVNQSAAEEKRFATLRAQFALAGHSLHKSELGGYFSQRWAMVRDLPTLDDAQAFLDRIGGRHG